MKVSLIQLNYRIISLARCTKREDAWSSYCDHREHLLDDGEARAAIGTVDKRIEIASVCRIKQFIQTVFTGSDIGRDECIAFGAAMAMSDHKFASLAEVVMLGRDKGSIRASGGNSVYNAC